MKKDTNEVRWYMVIQETHVLYTLLHYNMYCLFP